jgi:hypothetical protein
MKTISTCRKFYEKYVAAIIHEKFAEYETRIAAGVVGEGSECFGYDDEFSQDHDFGYGVCLWLTDEDCSAIGSELSASYYGALSDFEADRAGRSLTDTIQTIDTETGRTRYDQRRGVMRISDFYQNLLEMNLEMDVPSLTESQWFYIEEWKLAVATNGEVFRDDLGKFSEIRNMLLKYYPDRIWRMRLVNAMHGYAAAAQANYPRCMARGDEVTAAICKNQGIERAMEIVFLLNRRFAPYYKWTFRAMQELACEESSPHPGGKNWILRISELLKRIARLGSQTNAWQGYRYRSDSINSADELVRLFDEVAGAIVSELNRQGLTDSVDPFLELHSQALARTISN